MVLMFLNLFGMQEHVWRMINFYTGAGIEKFVDVTGVLTVLFKVTSHEVYSRYNEQFDFAKIEEGK